MLTIEIKANGRLIAGARVANASGLEDISSYNVEAVEGASDVTGREDYHENFRIERHGRRQTVWALVGKVAARVVEGRETGAGERFVTPQPRAGFCEMEG